MGEVHEELCGTHQAAPKMKWMLRRAGLYWTTMMDDCIRYQKDCEMCQRFGTIRFAELARLRHWGNRVS
jgi:hypothetical protein